MKNVTLSCLAALAALTVPPSGAADLPSGYWPVELSQPILDMTRTIRLAPDLSGLTDGEREAVRHLLEAGGMLQAGLRRDSRVPGTTDGLSGAIDGWPADYREVGGWSDSPWGGPGASPGTQG